MAQASDQRTVVAVFRCHFFIVMTPKKNPAVEETEDIRKTLDFLSQDIGAIKTKQDKILKLLHSHTVTNSDRGKGQENSRAGEESGGFEAILQDQ